MDGIQSLTGCTFGKGNLIHRDYGKNAYTFFRRSDGKAIRIVPAGDGWGPPDPEHQALRDKIGSGQATPADRARFQELHLARARAILERPLDGMFVIQPAQAELPTHARIHSSVTCASCGESVMETRARLFGGQMFCIPCFEARDRRY